ncbi:LOW QUALITY PROTEIN: hypothetical protein JCM24511_05360 [Saitozyma sp. JCM 24511]|nr:LOW QUALITY PROTEIN: hypothetical protein JCM24511_05360 [Saitozyma sp. JCM 24511]
MPSVLITGANRGIGLALTKAYAEKGYKVFAAVRDPGKMEAVNGVLVVKLDQGTLGDAKEAWFGSGWVARSSEKDEQEEEEEEEEEVDEERVEAEARKQTLRKKRREWRKRRTRRKRRKRRTRRKARNTMSTKARMREKIDTGYTGHSAEQAKDISQGAAISELKSKHGIDRLDLVICNAAINVTHAKFAELSMDDLEITWKTNVRGPLVLFQATLPLQPEGSKFVVVSSGAGTIGQKHRAGGGVYGQSKASVNYMVAKLHAEHPELVVLSLNPGWVPTEMGLQGAKWNGLDDTPQRLEDTLPGMIKVIDAAKKDTTSGLMVNYDGKPMAW